MKGALRSDDCWICPSSKLPTIINADNIVRVLLLHDNPHLVICSGDCCCSYLSKSAPIATSFCSTIRSTCCCCSAANSSLLLLTLTEAPFACRTAHPRVTTANSSTCCCCWRVRFSGGEQEPRTVPMITTCTIQAVTARSSPSRRPVHVRNVMWFGA